MPRLRPDLEARFVRLERRVETRRYVRAEVIAARPEGPFADEDLEGREGRVDYVPAVDRLEEADGVWFLCPLCFAANHGVEGTHGVLCWFVGRVPDDVDPKPGRWTPEGTSLDDLTFVPSEGRTQSVALLSGCAWHGLVVGGDAT